VVRGPSPAVSVVLVAIVGLTNGQSTEGTPGDDVID
jgi:hypothetical protein